MPTLFIDFTVDPIQLVEMLYPFLYASIWFLRMMINAHHAIVLPLICLLCITFGGLMYIQYRYLQLGFDQYFAVFSAQSHNGVCFVSTVRWWCCM